MTREPNPDPQAPDPQESAVRSAHRAIGGLTTAADVIDETGYDQIRWVARALRLGAALALVVLAEAAAKRLT